MKKTKLFVAIATVLIMSFAEVLAQDWNVPVGLTSSSGYLGTTSANDAVFYANSSERLRLYSIGGVGISSSLSISNTSSPNLNLVFSNGPSTSVFSFGIANANGVGSSISTTGDFYLYNGGPSTSSHIIIANKKTGHIKFSTGSTDTQKMIIQNDGKVGIGFSTVPSTSLTGGYKLAVGGNTNVDGKLVIGTTSGFTASTPFPGGYNLYVADGILTEKIKVAAKSSVNWSDFVFDKNYNLRPLEEVESFIKKNQHLPEIPSAEEVNANGVDLLEMDAKLLMKVEELTLYMIELKKQNDELIKQTELMKEEIKILKNRK